jgi:TPP-dependent pyruvate/acetoin dehydrogenase alpha subunit
MFDLFGGISNERFEESHKTHAASIIALLEILIANGLTTEEKFAATRSRASARIDQAWQAKKDEMAAEFAKEHPDQARAAEFLKKMLGGTCQQS